ncbi:MAG: integrin alpha, partial [Chloroflexi bacterium]|nr:integrin alpha [Chloroflexota bacterium]
ESYLILGKASGWARDANLSTADASFIGENAGDNSGYSVAPAGDVNGDGAGDFLIGALYHNAVYDSGEGQTYLFLSTPPVAPQPILPQKNVPTFSQWGIIGMTVVFATALVWVARRRFAAKAGS